MRLGREVGMWIDHKKAVVVNISAGHVSTKTLASDIAPHTPYTGSQEGGGEKKYEERHSHELDRFYDDVISEVGETDAVLLFGPGEAKLQLKDRPGRSHASSQSIVAVESTDKLTDPQIVAKVKEHYRLARWGASVGSTDTSIRGESKSRGTRDARSPRRLLAAE